MPPTKYDSRRVGVCRWQAAIVNYTLAPVRVQSEIGGTSPENSLTTKGLGGAALKIFIFWSPFSGSRWPAAQIMPELGGKHGAMSH